MPRALGDHLLAVEGGRTVGYCIYGDPSGEPILNCHGGLVSGHDVAPADADARRLGLCVISPDRPGVARTDRLPGRGMIPWVDADLLPLLEHLDVDRLNVMGWSAGGQFALAVAHRLAERVVRCAVIAGCLPLDDRARARQLSPIDRTLTTLSLRAPSLARLYFRATRALSLVAPRVLLRSTVREAPEDEAAAIRSQGRWFPTILGEGARQPRGGVDEYLTGCAPWGFTPEQVSVPVRIFQGDADRLVPPAWGRELARLIPHATITSYPGEGHFIGLTRRSEVLGYLAGTEVGSPPSP
ncbi:MAG: alpha/beta fold hydrolase [Acidimicrobiales bacterium]